MTLTRSQRLCLSAIRGRKITRAIDGTIHKPEDIKTQVLNRCQLEGWWEWTGGLATLTDEGLAMVKAVAPEQPRFLSAKAGRDYTTVPSLAVREEPECVDEATQDRFSQEGTQETVARLRQRELDREQMALADRLRLLEIEAAKHGVDITRQKRQILNRLRATEAKVRSKAA